MLLAEIRKDLKDNADAGRAGRQQRFHKEKLKTYGIMTPEVNRIAQKHFPQVKLLTKQELFTLCEELLASGYNEEASLAFYWLMKLKTRDKSDFLQFEKWLKKYVDTWSKCDDFCTHALGRLVHEFPEFVPAVKGWAKSENRWLRRASAVTLIYSVRRGRHLSHAMRTSDILLQDADDLVQKGYGWLLKEASNNYPKEVFAYVMQRRKKMPRTALRYAIEKLPEAMKKEAMKK